MKIAIIGGAGKMGRWFARFLHQDGKEVIICGRNENRLRETGHELGIAVAAIPEAVKTADAVLLSVPPNSFEAVVQQIVPYVKADQIIIDITSVKTLPVDIMHKYLGSATILGTHPMFGPGAKSFVNQNVILTPTNVQEADLAGRLKKYLEGKGARVSLMSPQEHDEIMSVVLGLSHFIALVAGDTLLESGKLEKVLAFGGTTFKVLLALAESVAGEDPEFYASLQTGLPGVASLEGLFQKRAQEWIEVVALKDTGEFIRRMKDLKAGLAQADPDFRKAYEKLYKIAEQL
ncbi:MAG: prephenate dehydrogenase [Dehalococcoidales bacterium]|nr:prephenate dehydrogenase [Dehalococcoidales bacterium]